MGKKATPKAAPRKRAARTTEQPKAKAVTSVSMVNRQTGRAATFAVEHVHTGNAGNKDGSVSKVLTKCLVVNDPIFGVQRYVWSDDITKLSDEA